MNFGDSIFQGDVRDRYADKAVSDVTATSSGGDLDEKLRKAAGTDGDIVNMMVGAKTRVEEAKATFRTDPAAGTAMLRQLENERSANIKGVLAYRKALSGSTNLSVVASDVLNGAEYVANAPYLNDDLVMPSGQTVKLGQYLSAPESRSSLEGQASSVLRRAGFDDKVSSMLYGFVSPSEGALDRVNRDSQSVKNYSANYNAQAKQTMEFFTGPSLGLDRADSNPAANEQLASRIDMANEIASNYDEYFQLFGTKTAEAMREAYNGLKDIGGPRVLMSVCRYASVYGAEHGISGGNLMRDVVSQIRGHMNAVTRSDRPQDGKAKDPDNFSIYEQSAAMITAMGELADSDAKFDFRNPSMRAEAVRLGDMLARMKASGLNFVSMCRGNGMDPGREMASMLVRGTTGTGVPGNMTDLVDAYLHDRTRLTGGKDFAEQVFDATGSAADYFASIERRNGGASSCPTADAMAADLNKVRDQTILPLMFKRGMSHKDVVSSLRTNYEDISSYASKISGALEKWFPGNGASQAAGLVTGYILRHESDENGGRLNIQDIIENLSADPDVMKSAPEAVTSMNDWMSANVKNAVLFAPYARKMFQKLRSQGLSPEAAQSRVSGASDMASKLLLSGGQWEAPFAAFIDSEMFPQWVKGESGEPDDVSYMRVNANRLDTVIQMPDGSKAVIKPGMYRDPRYRGYVQDALDQVNRDAETAKEARRRFEVARAANAAREG